MDRWGRQIFGLGLLGLAIYVVLANGRTWAEIRSDWDGAGGWYAALLAGLLVPRRWLWQTLLVIGIYFAAMSVRWLIPTIEGRMIGGLEWIGFLIASAICFVCACLTKRRINPDILRL